MVKSNIKYPSNNFCSYNHLPDSHLIEWKGTIEQKLWGLMIVWSETKYNYPFFDRIPNINWDEKVQEYIHQVIKTETIDSYYEVLMEFAAHLNDGHTAVIPPWKYEKPGHDYPPIELQVLENKTVIARVGTTDELLEQKIYPGLEILDIEGKPPLEYLEDKVLRVYSYGTPQADQAIGLERVLRGMKNTCVKLRVLDPEGKKRNITLTRNSLENNGSHFVWRLKKWEYQDPDIESKMITSDILYIKISNFKNQKVVKDFKKVIELANLTKINGMIIDIRYNLGGNDNYAFQILGSLTDKPLKAFKWKSPSYVPAYRSWGRPTEWIESDPIIIEPGVEKKYTGPIVVLTGPVTCSTAEDFLVPLKHSGRAVLVGEITSGSTGNPIYNSLPGGGMFRVVSLRAVFPEGHDYVGNGITPDVLVHPRQKDLYTGMDSVLEKGIEIVKNMNTHKNA